MASAQDEGGEYGEVFDEGPSRAAGRSAMRSTVRGAAEGEFWAPPLWPDSFVQSGKACFSRSVAGTCLSCCSSSSVLPPSQVG